MKTHGMPERFWVVTRPTPASGMEDICFACTVEGLMRQARGGLQEEEIVAITEAVGDDGRRASSTILLPSEY